MTPAVVGAPGVQRAHARSALDNWLLLGYLCFIVYGSLVPLDFHPLAFDEAWLRFRAMPYLHLGVESRADWVANGVLYVPLGFLVVACRTRRGGSALMASLLGLLLGVGLAFGVELAQLYFPARTVSANDVMAECLGSVLGVALALGHSRRRRNSPDITSQAGAWLESHALQVYATAYLMFCLFPFDLLISPAELADKLASDSWGWWLAGAGDASRWRIVLQLGLEVVLTAPFGLLLGQREARSRGASTGLWGAVARGLVLGALIEVAQFLIASGISQGASVLTRGAGFGIGYLVWQGRAHWAPSRVRSALARSVLLWLPVALLAIFAANGWFSGRWSSESAAIAQWRELHLLPFYYHYYTTETQALFSLASVALMYLPLGVLAWVRGRSAMSAALLGAGLAAVVEAGKLWLTGMHPDPTNVLIAAAACALLVVAAQAWHAPRAVPPVPSLPPLTSARPVVDPSSARTQAAASAPATASASVPSGTPAAAAALIDGRAAGWGWLSPALAALVSVAYLASGPRFAVATAALLAGSALLVWRRPAGALLLLPALLPVLDLAPWTGRYFWDEFDLLMAVCLGVAWLRVPGPGLTVSRGWCIGFGLLAASYAVSAVIGALPWPAPDANSFASYASPYNALRIAKGLLWAGIVVALIARLERIGQAPWMMLATGMALGLAGVVSFVVWERIAFVGLFDFSADYRVTGPFSAMRRGGAFVECYIAVAMPFVAWRAVDAGSRTVRVAASLLLLGASYAMLVTYSRNGYAALAATPLLLVWLTMRAPGRPRTVTTGLVVAAMAALCALVLTGGYARERLATSAQDLEVREAHWSDALAMRNPGLATALWGMGVGRFPATHFWRSREPVRAGSVAIERSADGSQSLRLGAGAKLYLDQMVGGLEPGRYRLALRLKANRPTAALDVSVCEKWMLTSRTCVGATVVAGVALGAWTERESSLDLAPLAEPNGRSVKFSLHTPAPGVVIDVAQVSLRSANGAELLRNGDFAQGLDHWLFSTDVDPPWHVHSLPVSVLFEQGWFGVIAWSVFLGGALLAGWGAVRSGHADAAAALAALLAFLVSGSLNTLIDEPRFLFLLIVVAAGCFAHRARMQASAAPSARVRPARGRGELARQPEPT